MGDWVAFGMSELQAYLTKHARFAAFCDELDLDRRRPGGLDPGSQSTGEPQPADPGRFPRSTIPAAIQASISPKSSSTSAAWGTRRSTSPCA